MQNFILPEGYSPRLSLFETEIAIKKLKDFFESALSEKLNLSRVSAPLFVLPETGLNDNLNGIERPVGFDILHQGGRVVEIVHSLAKWKRFALSRYNIPAGSGLYTDMNAIRRDEYADNLHSIYVDQWDWELSISRSDRTRAFLENMVRDIYGVFLDTEKYITGLFPVLSRRLPDSIHFITTQELEDMYPNLSPSEREHSVCRQYGAVFLMQIGGRLRSGSRHDGRAPDYDDWSLNGDIIFDCPLLGRSVELSSMGIRVDEASLLSQLKAAGCEERAELPFQSSLLAGKLPLSIGGGIGQSRLCMFFLEKAHIGEVQVSVWPEDMAKVCEEKGIMLL